MFGATKNKIKLVFDCELYIMEQFQQFNNLETKALALWIPENEDFQNLLVKSKFSRISYQRGEFLPRVLLKILERNLTRNSSVS